MSTTKFNKGDRITYELWDGDKRHTGTIMNTVILYDVQEDGTKTRHGVGEERAELAPASTLSLLKRALDVFVTLSDSDTDCPGSYEVYSDLKDAIRKEENNPHWNEWEDYV
jgi:hypothetical protein